MCRYLNRISPVTIDEVVVASVHKVLQFMEAAWNSNNTLDARLPAFSQLSCLVPFAF